MPTRKTPIESAAGKLISAIQKEWGEELGTSQADMSQAVMGRAHDLLMAAKNNEVASVLGGISINQYLGDLWVRRHPRVKEYISAFEKACESDVEG